MSTFDYVGMRADALELLELFGNALTLTRENDGATYDPGAGTYSGGTTTTLSGTGALVGYSNKELNNSEVRATDRKLLYQGDALLIGDLYGAYRVHALNNIDPDESGTILVIAQMRR